MGPEVEEIRTVKVGEIRGNNEMGNAGGKVRQVMGNVKMSSRGK